MGVHVHPAKPDELPENFTGVVVVRDGQLEVFYIQDYTMSTEERCAYADAALSAGVERIVRNRIGEIAREQ